MNLIAVNTPAEPDSNSTAAKTPIAKPKDFKIRMRSKKGSLIGKRMKRESIIQNALKGSKRPSTKEAIDRGNNISQISDNIDSTSCQFNTAYPIHTPVKQSMNKANMDANLLYGLSKTNESFKKYQQLSNGKGQDSTIGFSSSTHNTTGYNKSFGDSGFRSSKYTPGNDQSSIPRSSYYK